MEVYNVLGQQVKALGKLQTSQLQLNLSELANDTYIVRVISQSHTFQREVVVQK